jgi:FAD/FMN-containing dehydrogenase
MGDIDVQTIAGAISTGTHGTGTGFGNLATQVTGLRFVNGRGEVVTCSEAERPEVLGAARLSLGMLGIITEVELRCEPAFDLELRIDGMPLEELLLTYQQYNDAHRHFEAYWFPHTDRVLTKKLDVAPPGQRTSRRTDYLRDVLLENYALKGLCELSRWRGKAPFASQLAADLSGSHRKVAASYRVFSTTRLVRFNEMEYALPYAQFPEVMREITQRINSRHPDIFFPVEVRFVKGDTDSYLSPAWGRDTVYIACHVYHKKEYRPYFGDMQAIFRAYGGRPHWGKVHSLRRSVFMDIYPKFGTFENVRTAQDPDDIFLSEPLKAIFSPIEARVGARS